MKNQISGNWYIFLLKGIILVILSIFVFVYPEDTLRTGVVMLGILLFIYGIVIFIRGINLKKVDHNWNPLMAEGLAYLISGFLMSVAPMLMSAVVPYIIGIHNCCSFQRIIKPVNKTISRNNYFTSCMCTDIQTVIAWTNCCYLAWYNLAGGRNI